MFADGCFHTLHFVDFKVCTAAQTKFQSVCELMRKELEPEVSMKHHQVTFYILRLKKLA
jgi:hypothetical protein